MPNPISKKGSDPHPLGAAHPPLSAVPGRPGVLIAFTVLRDGNEFVPTKLQIEDGHVRSEAPCGPRGIYEATAYEYLMAAVMDHYRLKGLRK